MSSSSGHMKGVGTADGTIVGIIVGSIVGNCVGSIVMVGSGLGKCDGVGVGRGVGEGVGSKDGKGEGAVLGAKESVGRGVGERKSLFFTAARLVHPPVAGYIQPAPLSLSYQKSFMATRLAFKLSHLPIVRCLSLIEVIFPSSDGRHT